MECRIDAAVLKRFPELTIGVVVATGIGNGNPSARAASFLEARVERIRETWSNERLDTDPRIAAWREAYRSFGAKPNKHRCSVENMLRTILDGGDVSSINPVVDVYNAISLEHCMPVGGDDLDRVNGDIRLTVATGDERFVPLNGSEAVHPKPGEIIYRDDTDVLCRRWNWRECDKSKMTEVSTNVCLVVEGLPPAAADDVRRISEELAASITAHIGGATAIYLADRANPAVAI